MTIDEIKRTNVKISFREIETTVDQLLNKKAIKDLHKHLQGEKDSFVAQDLISEAIFNNLSINDVNIESIDYD